MTNNNQIDWSALGRDTAASSLGAQIEQKGASLAKGGFSRAITWAKAGYKNPSAMQTFAKGTKYAKAGKVLGKGLGAFGAGYDITTGVINEGLAQGLLSNGAGVAAG